MTRFKSAMGGIKKKKNVDIKSTRYDVSSAQEQFPLQSNAKEVSQLSEDKGFERQPKKIYSFIVRTM